MRKRIIDQDLQMTIPGEDKWLDVQNLAVVEITSEDPAHPIEEALSISENSGGWRASKAGRQTIRIIFDAPQRIQRIHLLFVEEQQARSQEFTLQWSTGNSQPFREIVRQQYNFSPGFSSEQQENYMVNLEDVKILELSLIPDIGGGNSLASISHLWVG